MISQKHTNGYSTLKLRLSEVYLYKQKRRKIQDPTEEYFDVFHIYEHIDDDDAVPITPKLSTNCVEPEKIINSMLNTLNSDWNQLRKLVTKSQLNTSRAFYNRKSRRLDKLNKSSVSDCLTDHNYFKLLPSIHQTDVAQLSNADVVEEIATESETEKIATGSSLATLTNTVIIPVISNVIGNYKAIPTTLTTPNMVEELKLTSDNGQNIESYNTKSDKNEEMYELIEVLDNNCDVNDKTINNLPSIHQTNAGKISKADKVEVIPTETETVIISTDSSLETRANSLINPVISNVIGNLNNKAIPGTLTTPNIVDVLDSTSKSKQNIESYNTKTDENEEMYELIQVLDNDCDVSDKAANNLTVESTEKTSKGDLMPKIDMVFEGINDNFLAYLESSSSDAEKKEQTQENDNNFTHEINKNVVNHTERRKPKKILNRAYSHIDNNGQKSRQPEMYLIDFENEKIKEISSTDNINRNTNKIRLLNETLCQRNAMSTAQTSIEILPKSSKNSFDETTNESKQEDSDITLVTNIKTLDDKPGYILTEVYDNLTQKSQTFMLKNYRCQICMKYNETLTELTNHMLDVHSMSYVCEICFMSFTTRIACNLHICENLAKYITIVPLSSKIKSSHEVELFRCRSCMSKFHKQETYCLHAQKHIRLFKCTSCNHKLLQAHEMLRHLYVNHNFLGVHHNFMGVNFSKLS